MLGFGWGWMKSEIFFMVQKGVDVVTDRVESGDWRLGRSYDGVGKGWCS